jgi:hypothetical protein
MALDPAILSVDLGRPAEVLAKDSYAAAGQGLGAEVPLAPPRLRPVQEHPLGARRTTDHPQGQNAAW